MNRKSSTLRASRGSAFGVGIALALFGSGCAWVRPVSLKPSLSAPPAYVSEARDAPLRAGGAAPPRLADDASASDGGPTGAEPGSTDAPTPETPWWTAFADPALDAAIQEALQRNYQIRDLRNLIHENKLEPAMPKGVLWPLRIDALGTVRHVTSASPPALGQPGYASTYNDADVGIAASYQVDVWGQLDVQRRTFEDLVEQQSQSTEVLAQSLAEQVTQLWFQILELRALRELLEEQVQYSQDLLRIVEARFQQHLAPRLVVLQQEQQLLNTRAQVPLVVAQLTLLSSNLALLLGRMPTADVELVPGDRRLPDLPPAPGVGVPANLLRNSPELRLAQARVAEAEHLVSQNLASSLPTIELFGNVGVQAFNGVSSPNLSEHFTTGSVGARLTWSIFDGGQRITRAKQLTFTVERRNWQYELALKTAVKRVQDALVQEHKQADNLRVLRAQVDLGRRVLLEARQLFEQGQSDYLPVLTALANLSNLERGSIQAQRLLLSYRIQLYHALGGTWSKAATELVTGRRYHG
jgi:outer membrane protein TolC